MILTTHGIVLHSRKFGDTSRIVVLYTETLGKVSVVAKGVRKPKSPFGSALEPLAEVNVTLYHKRNRELHTASAAEMTIPRRQLQSSLEYMTAGMLVTEMALRTQTDEQPDRAVWGLLRKGLEAMDTCTNPYAVSVHMRLALAERMGFGLPAVTLGQPAPSAQNTRPPAISVNPLDGMPRPDHMPGIRMSRSAYARLCEFCSDEQLHAASIVSAADQLEIESFITSYFSYHLDRNVSSRAYNVLVP